MIDIKTKWENTGILNEFDVSKHYFVAKELEELCNVINKTNIQVPPAIIHTFVIMIRDKVSYGNVEWFIKNYMEYYDKYPNVEGFDEENFYSYKNLQIRSNHYLKWLKNRRSLIL